MTSTLTVLGVCDYAACKTPATTRRGTWGFCDPHAAEDARLDTPDPEEEPAAPVRVPGGGSSPLQALLDAAAEHKDVRVQRLAHQAVEKLDLLRQRMKNLAEQETARARAARADAAVKAAARSEVERLERELSVAKARLRGKPAAASAAVSSRVLEQLPCRKGCGKMCAGPQGRGGHERQCTGAV